MGANVVKKREKDTRKLVQKLNSTSYLHNLFTSLFER